MPQHVHPALRAREEVAQAAGLILNLESDGVLRQKNAEQAGVTFRPIIASGPIIYNNVSYQPNATISVEGNKIINGVVS